jgi:hypothetical protein
MMAASDYVPMLVKNRLHLAGRPQMSTRPKLNELRDRVREGPEEYSHGYASGLAALKLIWLIERYFAKQQCQHNERGCPREHRSETHCL